jgi:hypothetical protein
VGHGFCMPVGSDISGQISQDVRVRPGRRFSTVDRYGIGVPADSATVTRAVSAAVRAALSGTVEPSGSLHFLAPAIYLPGWPPVVKMIVIWAMIIVVIVLLRMPLPTELSHLPQLGF